MYKTLSLLTLGLVFLIGCKDSEDPTPAIYTTVDYDSLYLKSFDTAYTHQIGVNDSYFGFEPAENTVTYPFDVDKENGNDFIMELNHNLYCSGPHYCYQQYSIIIQAVDTNVFSVAVVQLSTTPEIDVYEKNSAINNGLIYNHMAYISNQSVGGGYEHKGNIYLGFRKKLPTGEYRYGSLNMFVGMSQLYLLQAVLNTNKDECIVN